MKQVIASQNAPKAIGPYSQAIKANGFLFVSGCLALCPSTHEVKNDSIQQETEQAFENLKAILDEAGCGFENLVKVTVFLRDMAIYKEVNEIYERYVPQPFPARTAIAVKELPLNVSLEIDVIAVCEG